MKSTLIILGLALFLVATLSNVGATSEEYINEFNIAGESCEVIDYFVYDIKCPSFFNSERYCNTVPTIYACCNQDLCTTIIFDLKNKIFLEEKYNSEIVDLNFIKYSLNNGNISETQFNLKGFDICSSFGYNEIGQESINVAASAAESISPFLEVEKARKIEKTIQVARNIGVVNKFNPAVLAASVTCTYNSEKLNQAIESLANTNAYLLNIKNNYAKEGYIYGLTTQIDLAKANLKIYLDSPVSMARGAANWFVNAISALFKFASNSSSGKIDIEKNEYQLALEAQSQLSGYNLYLHNINNAQILTKQNARVNTKISNYNSEYSLLSTNYLRVKNLKPSFITVLFTNFFMDPNYNLSEANSYFATAKQSKGIAENSIKVYKFNTALSYMNQSSNYFSLSEPLYLREHQIERKLDLWPLFLAVLFFVLGYFVYKKYTQ